MATIYQAWKYDTSTDRNVIADGKGTMKWVSKVGSGVVTGSEEEVPDDAVDKEGRYVPAKKP